MNKEISIKQYRAIDMAILSLILCALEIASRLALSAFPNELFSFSVVLPITLIAIMRHGRVGVIVSAIGAIIYSLVNGAALNVYMIYLLGNACVVISLLWFGLIGKKTVQDSTVLIIIYVISGYIAMNVGRGIFATIIGDAPFVATTIRYLTTDALSGIMAVIIVLIASRQDGVFEDQIVYLKRLAAKEEQKNAN